MTERIFSNAPAMCRRVFIGLVFFLAAHASIFALDRNAWTFTSYNLEAKVVPVRAGMNVSGSIELRNDSNVPQKDISLQISSSLSWRAITLDGNQLAWLTQPYTSDIDHTGVLSEAIVTLPQAVAPGGSVKLDIHYEGEISADASRLTRIGAPSAVAVRSDWDQITSNFTAVRGLGYVAWYPVSIEAASLSNGTDVWDAIANWKHRHAQSTLTVRWSVPHRAEEHPVLVCTGQLIRSQAPQVTKQKSTNPDDAQSLVNDNSWSEYTITASETPVFSVANYQSLDREKVVVHFLFDHSHLAQDYALGAEKAVGSIRDWFGDTKQKITIVELADPEALPYDTGTYLFVPLKPAPPLAVETAMARLATRAAFQSSRPWIREGLAAFSQALVRERQQGRKAALAYLNQFVNALVRAEAVKPAPPVDESSTSKPQEPQRNQQPLVTTNDELYYRTKAAFVWWMLRDMAGDDAVKSAISRYKPSDDREPGYMQRLIETATPQRRDFEAFFDSWVYRDRGLPDLAIVSAYPRQTLSAGPDKPGTYVVTVTVENKGEAWAEVPVTVRGNKGEVSSRVAVAPHEKTIARVSFPADPSEVVINDGSVPEEDISNNKAMITLTPGK